MLQTLRNEEQKDRNCRELKVVVKWFVDPVSILIYENACLLYAENVASLQMFKNVFESVFKCEVYGQHSSLALQAYITASLLR